MFEAIEFVLYYWYKLNLHLWKLLQDTVFRTDDNYVHICMNSLFYVYQCRNINNISLLH